MAATIKDITGKLEQLAPGIYQEEYDNSGLITGNSVTSVTGILVTLDCTEAVVEEAIQQNCNLIVAHHPILFKGIKKLTGQNYVERTLLKAIQNNIAIYAIHTNLDNVHMGVNRKIAERIGLTNLKVLLPRPHTLLKLVTFVPQDHAENVRNHLYAAGAGQIGNYKNCSFSIIGEGTFMPTEAAKPFLGTQNKVERTSEVRVEVILSVPVRDKVLNALKNSHPYEEVAYYLSSLENDNQEVGSGMMGELTEPMDAMAFLQHLKKQMNTGCVRYTTPPQKAIKKVAICGGSGSFLLNKAIAKGADAFVSADFKYHEFFDADGKILIADIGHYESEQYTKDLLIAFLQENFPTFAISFSKVVTNPICYL
ncbi:MAG TPA: Nif3-like dinuclear metal center hexameric protein [Cyclobacteriaceae bacterium]|jgi:dinuclear metal center YbgI/SA1388 family protein|nr:Nif3-like dinuclear metal center hexameric protein [Cytophagales bacterium]HRE67916.1 Nif3-like dinuclear metal center hexameric protein [Cyclobacteriaceae bacterium]HRF34044.1 Nif3-like dinuclear metal center hexameric protein [Cyclobacteriaceae bacterium]